MEENTSSKSMMPLVNYDPFFMNDDRFSNTYIVNSQFRNISPSPYEKNLIEKYVIEELGFSKQKEINFDSQLIKLILDYSRYNSYHS